jgi:lysozyme family protein
MKFFSEAYASTMGHEGGYCNDPVDLGGETYKGISRVYNPSWKGWRVIDDYKTFTDFPENLKKDRALQKNVMNYYKDKYFDDYRGDDMPQNLAMEMFDTSVNMGIGRAIKFLQTALNVLNRNEKMYRDMMVDGSYGPTTHNTLRTYLQTDKPMVLCKIINVLQGNHYIEYMKKSPEQEKYARGWLKRVQIRKGPND